MLHREIKVVVAVAAPSSVAAVGGGLLGRVVGTFGLAW